MRLFKKFPYKRTKATIKRILQYYDTKITIDPDDRYDYLSRSSPKVFSPHFDREFAPPVKIRYVQYYRLEVAYMVEGIEYSDVLELRTINKWYKVNDSVTIRYHRDNPSKAYDGTNKYTLADIVLSILLGILIIGICILLFSIVLNPLGM